MAHRNTNRKIKPDKWYLVNCLDLSTTGTPRLYSKEFDNRLQAVNCLKRHKFDNYLFDFIKGRDAIRLKLNFTKKLMSLGEYLYKYNYLNYMIDYQDKKSYRTKYRRHQRRKRGHLYKKWG
jgi:hypothetical protein